MPQDFDVDGARKAGFTDAQIAEYLAKTAEFDINGARSAGFNDLEIITHLNPPGATPDPMLDRPLGIRAPKVPGPFDLPGEMPKPFTQPGPFTPPRPPFQRSDALGASNEIDRIARGDFGVPHLPGPEPRPEPVPYYQRQRPLPGTERTGLPWPQMAEQPPVDYVLGGADPQEGYYRNARFGLDIDPYQIPRPGNEDIRMPTVAGTLARSGAHSMTSMMGTTGRGLYELGNARETSPPSYFDPGETIESEGAAELVAPGMKAVGRGMMWAGETADKWIPEDPAGERPLVGEKTFWEDPNQLLNPYYVAKLAGSAGGSIVAYMAPHLLMLKGAAVAQNFNRTRKVGMALRGGVPTTLMTAIETLGLGGEVYDEARRRNKTPKEAHDLMMQSLGPNFVGTWILNRFGMFNERIQSKPGRAIAGAVGEGGEEVYQGGTQNVLMGDPYFKDAPENFAGGFMGGPIGTGIQMGVEALEDVHPLVRIFGPEEAQIYATALGITRSNDADPLLQQTAQSAIEDMEAKLSPAKRGDLNRLKSQRGVQDTARAPEEEQPEEQPENVVSPEEEEPSVGPRTVAFQRDFHEAIGNELGDAFVGMVADGTIALDPGAPGQVWVHADDGTSLQFIQRDGRLVFNGWRDAQGATFGPGAVDPNVVADTVYQVANNPNPTLSETQSELQRRRREGAAQPTAPVTPATGAQEAAPGPQLQGEELYRAASEFAQQYPQIGITRLRKQFKITPDEAAGILQRLVAEGVFTARPHKDGSVSYLNVAKQGPRKTEPGADKIAGEVGKQVAPPGAFGDQQAPGFDLTKVVGKEEEGDVPGEEKVEEPTREVPDAETAKRQAFVQKRYLDKPESWYATLEGEGARPAWNDLIKAFSRAPYNTNLQAFAGQAIRDFRGGPGKGEKGMEAEPKTPEEKDKADWLEDQEGEDLADVDTPEGEVEVPFLVVREANYAIRRMAEIHGRLEQAREKDRQGANDGRHEAEAWNKYRDYEFEIAKAKQAIREYREAAAKRGLDAEDYIQAQGGFVIPELSESGRRYRDIGEKEEGKEEETKGPEKKPSASEQGKKPAPAAPWDLTLGRAARPDELRVEEKKDGKTITLNYYQPDGKYVGFGKYHGRFSLIVQVEPKFRRLGYGTRIHSDMQARGVTDSTAGTPEGKALLESRGWVEGEVADQFSPPGFEEKEEERAPTSPEDERVMADWDREHAEMKAREEANPLWEMTLDELEEALKEAKARDHADLVEIFGSEEKAKQYEKAERQAESDDPKKADRGQAILDDMVEGLTEAQQDKLYGMGATGYQVEALKEYRDALVSLDWGSPEDLGISLKYAVMDIGQGDITKPAVMGYSERQAYAQIRTALAGAKERGWDLKKVLAAATKAASELYPDIEDAEFMLRRFLGRGDLAKLGEKEEAKPEPKTIEIGEGGIPSLTPEELESLQRATQPAKAKEEEPAEVKTPEKEAPYPNGRVVLTADVPEAIRDQLQYAIDNGTLKLRRHGQTDRYWIDADNGTAIELAEHVAADGFTIYAFVAWTDARGIGYSGDTASGGNIAKTVKAALGNPNPKADSYGIDGSPYFAKREKEALDRAREPKKGKGKGKEKEPGEAKSPFKEDISQEPDWYAADFKGPRPPWSQVVELAREPNLKGRTLRQLADMAVSFHQETLELEAEKEKIHARVREGKKTATGPVVIEVYKTTANAIPQALADLKAAIENGTLKLREASYNPEYEFMDADDGTSILLLRKGNSYEIRNWYNKDGKEYDWASFAPQQVERTIERAIANPNPQPDSLRKNHSPVFEKGKPIQYAAPAKPESEDLAPITSLEKQEERVVSVEELEAERERSDNSPEGIVNRLPGFTKEQEAALVEELRAGATVRDAIARVVWEADSYQDAVDRDKREGSLDAPYIRQIADLARVEKADVAAPQAKPTKAKTEEEPAKVESVEEEKGVTPDVNPEFFHGPKRDAEVEAEVLAAIGEGRNAAELIASAGGRREAYLDAIGALEHDRLIEWDWDTDSWRPAQKAGEQPAKAESLEEEQKEEEEDDDEEEYEPEVRNPELEAAILKAIGEGRLAKELMDMKEFSGENRDAYRSSMADLENYGFIEYDIITRKWTPVKKAEPAAKAPEPKPRLSITEEIAAEKEAKRVAAAAEKAKDEAALQAAEEQRAQGIREHFAKEPKEGSVSYWPEAKAVFGTWENLVHQFSVFKQPGVSLSDFVRFKTRQAAEEAKAKEEKPSEVQSLEEEFGLEIKPVERNARAEAAVLAAIGKGRNAQHLADSPAWKKNAKEYTEALVALQQDRRIFYDLKTASWKPVKAKPAPKAKPELTEMEATVLKAIGRGTTSESILYEEAYLKDSIAFNAALSRLVQRGLVERRDKDGETSWRPKRQGQKKASYQKEEPGKPLSPEEQDEQDRMEGIALDAIGNGTTDVNVYYNAGDIRDTKGQDKLLQAVARLINKGKVMVMLVKGEIMLYPMRKPQPRPKPVSTAERLAATVRKLADKVRQLEIAVAQATGARRPVAVKDLQAAKDALREAKSGLAGPAPSQPKDTRSAIEITQEALREASGKGKPEKPKAARGWTGIFGPIYKSIRKATFNFKTRPSQTGTVYTNVYGMNLVEHALDDSGLEGIALDHESISDLIKALGTDMGLRPNLILAKGNITNLKAELEKFQAKYPTRSLSFVSVDADDIRLIAREERIHQTQFDAPLPIEAVDVLMDDAVFEKARANLDEAYDEHSTSDLFDEITAKILAGDTLGLTKEERLLIAREYREALIAEYGEEVLLLFTHIKPGEVKEAFRGTTKTTQEDTGRAAGLVKDRGGELQPGTAGGREGAAARGGRDEGIRGGAPEGVGGRGTGEGTQLTPTPPPAAGMVRVYRVDTSTKTGKGVPEWVQGSEEFAAIKGATGRWFSTEEADVQWYLKNEAEPGAAVSYVDLPAAEAERYTVKNLSGDIRKFSARPDTEVFLPRKTADQAQPYVARPAGQAKASRSKPSRDIRDKSFVIDTARTMLGEWSAGRVKLGAIAAKVVSQYGAKARDKAQQVAAQVQTWIKRPQRHHTKEASTTQPSGPTAIRNPITGLVITGIHNARLDSEAFGKAVALVNKYVNFRDIQEASVNATVEKIIGRMVDNLLWLHDRYAKLGFAARAKLWYDGGRKKIAANARQFGITVHQAAAIMAAFSPQKDWFQNVDMTRRFHEWWETKDTLEWTPEMEAIYEAKVLPNKEKGDAERIRKAERKYQEAREKYPEQMAQWRAEIAEARRNGVPVAERPKRPKFPRRKEVKVNTKVQDRFAGIRGKAAREITDVAEMAVWFRLWDEAHNDRDYRILTPEGELGDRMMIKDKNGSLRPAEMAWSGYDPMMKAIRIMQDGSFENISEQLGEVHKVRNFYNNLLDPDNPNGHITCDTHAVCAALLLPRGASAPEVLHNLGSGVQSVRTGEKGTYWIFAEAYRRAARLRGILPREMQSITWEATRGLFTGKKSEGYNNWADALWVDVGAGKLTAKEAREKLYAHFGKINPPAWSAGGRAISDVGSDEEEGGAADEAELPERDSVRQRGRRGTPKRRGGDESAGDVSTSELPVEEEEEPPQASLEKPKFSKAKWATAMGPFADTKKPVIANRDDLEKAFAGASIRQQFRSGIWYLNFEAMRIFSYLHGEGSLAAGSLGQENIRNILKSADIEYHLIGGSKALKNGLLTLAEELKKWQKAHPASDDSLEIVQYEPGYDVDRETIGEEMLHSDQRKAPLRHDVYEKLMKLPVFVKARAHLVNREGYSSKQTAKYLFNEVTAKVLAGQDVGLTLAERIEVAKAYRAELLQEHGEKIFVEFRYIKPGPVKDAFLAKMEPAVVAKWAVAKESPWQRLLNYLGDRARQKQVKVEKDRAQPSLGPPRKAGSDQLKFLTRAELEGHHHGTSRKHKKQILAEGKFREHLPRSYSYSEWGPALYAAPAGSVWLGDEETTGSGRMVHYPESLSLQLDPDTRIAHLHTEYDLKLLAQAAGYENFHSLISELNFDADDSSTPVPEAARAAAKRLVDAGIDGIWVDEGIRYGPPAWSRLEGGREQLRENLQESDYSEKEIERLINEPIYTVSGNQLALFNWDKAKPVDLTPGKPPYEVEDTGYLADDKESARYTREQLSNWQHDPSLDKLLERNVHGSHLDAYQHRYQPEGKGVLDFPAIFLVDSRTGKIHGLLHSENDEPGNYLRGMVLSREYRGMGLSQDLLRLAESRGLSVEPSKYRQSKSSAAAVNKYRREQHEREQAEGKEKREPIQASTRPPQRTGQAPGQLRQEFKEQLKEYREDKSSPALKAVKEFFVKTYNLFTREYKDLPDGARYAPLRMELKKTNAAKANSQHRAHQALQDQLKGMEPEDLEDMMDVIIIDDLYWRVKKQMEDGHTVDDEDLPWGLTKRTLAATRREVRAAARANPKVDRALTLRKQMQTELRTNLIVAFRAAGYKDLSDILKNPDYFRHRVIEYIDAEENKGGGERFRLPVGRGYLRKSWVNKKAYSADYMRTEWQVMNQMMFDTARAEFLAFVRNPANGLNVARDVQRRAAEINKATIMPAFARMARHHNQQNPQGTQYTAATMYDHVMSSHPHDPSFKERLTRQMAGKKYMNFKRTFHEYFSKTHEIYQPVKGDHFFLASSIPQQVAEEAMLEGEATILKEQIRTILARGKKREELVLPKELVRTMEGFHAPPKPGSAGDIARKIWGVPQTYWKQSRLVGPTGFVIYNKRNMTGDLWRVLTVVPRAFKHVVRSWKDLKAFRTTGHPPNAEFKEWWRRGGFQSGYQAAEMGGIQTERKLRDSLVNINPTMTKKALRVATKAWDLLWWGRKWTDIREGLLRYATFLEYLRQIEANGRSNDYGASKREEVDALTDKYDKAYKLSNDTMLAYDEVSEGGKWLRRYPFPFFSFTEKNLQTHIQLMKNAAIDGRQSAMVGYALMGGAAQVVHTSAVMASFMGRTAILMMLLKGLATAFQWFFQDEEEEDIPDSVKKDTHLIYGRDSEGIIHGMTRIGLIDEVLEWAGLNGLPFHAREYLNGRMSLQEWADEYFFKAWGHTIPIPIIKPGTNKLAQMLTPWAKYPLEIWSKKSMFPDAYNPRTIRDRGQYIARELGVLYLYNWAMGHPQPPLTWRSGLKMLAYQWEPKQTHYNSFRYDKVPAWTVEHGKGRSRGGFSESPAAEALYLIREGIKYGDRDAMIRGIIAYKEAGGTVANMQDSIDRLHPAGQLTDEGRKAFEKSLTPKEKIAYKQAVLFWTMHFKSKMAEITTAARSRSLPEKKVRKK